MTTTRTDSFDHLPRPPRLFTFSSGGWVLLLSAIFSLFAAVLVLWPVWETGWYPALGDGKNIDTYGFDLSNLAASRKTLIASPNFKDQIRAIPPNLVQTLSPEEVLLMNENERRTGRFLVSTDRVIGVAINGQTRAYPLRVLCYHEIINDVLGGVPIAVTYSPLCDSAAVFDRRIDAGAGEDKPPVEFGVSGLLEDSDLVMFDRRKNNKDESLWPQLTIKAVSGPRLGQQLKVIPFQLVSWKHWTDTHKDTRVVEGLRTLKQQYKMEPYNNYYSNDDLKFPVDPLWNNPDIPKKTRIALTSTDNGKSWTATPAGYAAQNIPETLSTTAPANSIRLYSFLFAWYAQHPTDTDYSAIK